jgi:hypothetical protein
MGSFMLGVMASGLLARGGRERLLLEYEPPFPPGASPHIETLLPLFYIHFSHSLPRAISGSLNRQVSGN